MNISEFYDFLYKYNLYVPIDCEVRIDTKPVLSIEIGNTYQRGKALKKVFVKSKNPYCLGLISTVRELSAKINKLMSSIPKETLIVSERNALKDYPHFTFVYHEGSNTLYIESSYD